MTKNRVLEALSSKSVDERFDELDDLEVEVTDDGASLTPEEEETVEDLLRQNSHTYEAAILWCLLESMAPTPQLKEFAVSVLMQTKREDRSSAAGYLNHLFPEVLEEKAAILVEDTDLSVQFEVALSIIEKNAALARKVLERIKKEGTHELAAQAAWMLSKM